MLYHGVLGYLEHSEPLVNRCCHRCRRWRGVDHGGWHEGSSSAPALEQRWTTRLAATRRRARSGCSVQGRRRGEEDQRLRAGPGRGPCAGTGMASCSTGSNSVDQATAMQEQDRGDGGRARSRRRPLRPVQPFISWDAEDSDLTGKPRPDIEATVPRHREVTDLPTTTIHRRSPWQRSEREPSSSPSVVPSVRRTPVPARFRRRDESRSVTCPHRSTAQCTTPALSSAMVMPWSEQQ